MRIICLFLIAVCVLAQQVPIGLGLGDPALSFGLLHIFDWNAATASGCSAGANEYCVGSSGPFGDTEYWGTAWKSDGTTYGTFNDFGFAGHSGNLMVAKLSGFAWPTPTASKITAVNYMSDYGTSGADTDSPGGWHGHCTSNDDGGQACTWKSRAPFIRGGLMYLPVERQISSGTTSIHDATLMVSADFAVTWKNPYTVANGGSASATGDAPTCDSSASGGGNPCTAASYPGSILWPALPYQLSQWEVIQYGQDGGTLPTVNDGCDPAIYTCFLGGEQDGSVMRVLNSALPNLVAADFEYYTCPTATAINRCPGNLSSSWTSTFASRTSTIEMSIPNGATYVKPNAIFGLAYVKEFHGYLATGYQNQGGSANAAAVLLWAPAAQGPWTLIRSLTPVTYGIGAGSSVAMFPGFLSPTLAFGYTVVSSNPPEVKITLTADTADHDNRTTPLFGEVDLVLGQNTQFSGEGARWTNTGNYVLNSGLIYSAANRVGTIPRKGLVGGYDFYDHGGDVNISDPYYWRDLGTGSGNYIYPCTVVGCGSYVPGQGMSIETFGAKLVDGYNARMESSAGVPTAMQGNGSYTVAGIFRCDGNSFANPSLWAAGTGAPTTTVSLNYASNCGLLELGWGGMGFDRYRFLSAFNMTASNWYFIASSVQANGATPVAHVWVGVGGALVDEIAGVSYAASAGSPTATPNVASTPFKLGLVDANQSAGGDQSYSGLWIYDRPLTRQEIGQMYRTVKSVWTKRSVTIQ